MNTKIITLTVGILFCIPAVIIAQDNDTTTYQEKLKEIVHSNNNDQTIVYVVVRGNDPNEEPLEMKMKIIEDEVTIPNDATLEELLDLFNITLKTENVFENPTNVIFSIKSGENEMLFHFDYQGNLVYITDKNEIDTPVMGVNIEDITFPKAYEMHYPNNYGALLTRVVKGSDAERAGLRKNDIIALYNGEKVRGHNHLSNLIKSSKIGDIVKIHYSRNGKHEFYTTYLTYSSIDQNCETDVNTKHKAGKLSPGFGGGGPYAKFVDFDYSGINEFITGFGFFGLSPERTIYFGGGGMGNIGKGWFLGGKGFGFKHTEDITIGTGVKRHLIVENGFGGVTLTKKFPVFSEKFVVDTDLMLGGGTIFIKIGESDGFDWSSSEITGQLQSFEKYYLAAETSIGLMYRVTNWFGFHGRVGQFEIFTLNDNWTESTFDADTYTVNGDAPEIPSGNTYSIGVWFGY